MSRLANKKIAGYFPTPTAIVERIAGHLLPPPAACPERRPEAQAEGPATPPTPSPTTNTSRSAG